MHSKLSISSLEKIVAKKKLLSMKRNKIRKEITLLKLKLAKRTTGKAISK